MKPQLWILPILIAAIGVALLVMEWRRPRSTAVEAESAPVAMNMSMPMGNHVMASSPLAAGKYLVQVGGCNDCHTPGWMQNPGKIPESQWLTGVPVGWRGPWGTTYAANLRQFVQTLDEDAWVKMARTRKSHPPMPWSVLNDMTEPDLRVLYQYIKHLGPAGETMPAYVPPDQTPKGPYLDMTVKMP